MIRKCECLISASIHKYSLIIVYHEVYCLNAEDMYLKKTNNSARNFSVYLFKVYQYKFDINQNTITE